MCEQLAIHLSLKPVFIPQMCPFVSTNQHKCLQQEYKQGKKTQPSFRAKENVGTVVISTTCPFSIGVITLILQDIIISSYCKYDKGKL